MPVKVPDSLLESPSLQPSFAMVPIGAGAAQNKLQGDGKLHNLYVINIYTI
jgi:hypothetical protein